MDKKIAVLLPTLNEKVSIGRTIKEIQAYLPSAQIVVADSSADGTAEIAAKLGALVIKVPKAGKGKAVQDVLPGLQLYEKIIMIDGDYTYPAKYLPRMIWMMDNGADVVVGNRTQFPREAMSHTNQAGNKILSLLASILYFTWMPDVCSGMWGFQQTVIGKFHITSKGFTLEADLFVNAVRTNCRIMTLPIEYRARTDKSKLTVLDGVKIGLFLIRERFKFDKI